MTKKMISSDKIKKQAYNKQQKEKEERSKKLREKWLEFCKKYNLDPDDHDKDQENG